MNGMPPGKPMMAAAAASPDTAADQTGDDQDEAGKTEITLCIYSDGRLALEVNDGDEVSVKTIDQALAGIKAFAAQEMGSEDQNEIGGEAPDDEQAEFQQGFKGVRG